MRVNWIRISAAVAVVGLSGYAAVSVVRSFSSWLDGLRSDANTNVAKKLDSLRDAVLVEKAKTDQITADLHSTQIALQSALNGVASLTKKIESRVDQLADRADSVMKKTGDQAPKFGEAAESVSMIREDMRPVMEGLDASLNTVNEELPKILGHMSETSEQASAAAESLRSSAQSLDAVMKDARVASPEVFANVKNASQGLDSLAHPLRPIGRFFKKIGRMFTRRKADAGS